MTGLAVFAREPADPADAHPRVLSTPHVGGVTRTALRRATLFADNVHRWASGQPPRWAVNAPPNLRSTPG